MNAMEQKNKMVIYQVFPRWFGNLRPSPVMNGSLAENGVGKFSAFTSLALSKIKELCVTHVWYTGCRSTLQKPITPCLASGKTILP